MAPKTEGDTPAATEVVNTVDQDVTDRIRMIWDWMMNYREPDFFDSTLRGHVNFLSASIDPNDQNRGFAKFHLKVPISLCNGGSNLHGGAVALIFDICTSMALSAIAREGFWDSGHVSRSLNCIYMRPAPVDADVLIETEVSHVGKTMAQLRGTMRRRDNGKILYTCEHGKVAVAGYGMPESISETADKSSKL